MIATLLIVLFALLFLSTPIAASIGFACVSVFKTFPQFASYEVVLGQSNVSSLDSFSLLAIPYFMLMGSLMSRTGIAGKLVSLAKMLTGDRPGGLGMAAVIASMFFAAISGSGPATVAAVGGILAMPMIEQGYDRAYTGSLLAAGSTIGPVIPPSIPMVMFGVTIGVSVTEMFTAGFFPGFLMGAGLIIYNHFISKKHGWRGNVNTMTRAEKKELFVSAIPAILMPIIVLGGIYAGIFTPTECAAVGVVYCLIVGKFVYMNLTMKKFTDALFEAAITSATVMILFGSANVLGRLLTIGKISQTMQTVLTTISENRFVIMLMINSMLLIIGMFLDTISSILIFAPVFAPIMSALGYDMAYFGVIMVVNLCIGMITPPMAANFYIGQRLAGATFEGMLKQILPIIGVLCITLILMLIFPQIVTFLPALLGM